MRSAFSVSSSSSSNGSAPKFTPAPHSGYHRRGNVNPNRNKSQSFFEGWYFRLSISREQSVSLIYHVYDPDDENQLLSCGSFLLLTSPDITAISKLEYSNGNCEVLIVELPQMDLTASVLYRPPKPNFREALSNVEAYLQQKIADEPNAKVRGLQLSAQSS